MPDRELKLNSLSRYVKQSTRMVLEEYSNCEVPAGCGGVVLRWRKPEEPLPMILREHTENGYLRDEALDGVPIYNSARIPVTYGRHVFSAVAQNVNPTFALLLLEAHVDEQYVRILRPAGDTTLLSLPDGSWRYSLRPQETEAWRALDYDESGWLPLVKRRLKKADDSFGKEWTEEITSRGAVGLGINTSAAFRHEVQAALGAGDTIPAVYIRKTFTLEPRRREEQRDGD